MKVIIISLLCLLTNALHLRNNNGIIAQGVISSSSNWVIADEKGIPGNVTVKGNKLSWISPNDTDDDDILMDSSVSCSALWDDGSGGVNAGEHYWELTFVGSDLQAAIGLTNKTRISQSAKTAQFGLLYDGFLTTGDGELLNATTFGPSPTSGSVVGILTSFKSNRLQIFFFMNSYPLGLGYDVPASVLPNAYPAIQLTDSGAVSIAKRSVPKMRTPNPLDPKQLAGDWLIIPSSIKLNGIVKTDFAKMQNDPEFKLRLSLSPQLPIGGEKLLDITDGPTPALPTSDLKLEGYHLGYLSSDWVTKFHLNYTIKNKERFWKVLDFEVSSPIDDGSFRQFVNKLFVEADTIEVNEDLSLIVKNTNSEIMFQRCKEKAEPVKQNPFSHPK